MRYEVNTAMVANVCGLTLPVMHNATGSCFDATHCEDTRSSIYPATMHKRDTHVEHALTTHDVKGSSHACAFKCCLW